MKKAWWLLLLLIPVAQAVTIADWPAFFVSDGKFEAKYVVGEEAPSLDVVSATVISTSLARFENVTTTVGTATLDTEITDITKYDAIVVGSPCDNSAAAQLLGNPEPCYKDFGGSVGYIKLFEKNGKVQLLITGLDEKDRNAAARYLAEKSMANIKTTEFIVPSNSGSLPQFFELKLKNKTISNVTEASANVTEMSPSPSPEATPSPEPKVTPGPYEALEELPKKKGFWNRFWAWLKSLFT